MAREMVSVKRIEGWGCSRCAWIFTPSGPPLGYTIDEMKLNFVKYRDTEFTSHVCSKQLRILAQELSLAKKTEKFQPGHSSG
jgi:hypothetical protein